MTDAYYGLSASHQRVHYAWPKSCPQSPEALQLRSLTNFSLETRSSGSMSNPSITLSTIAQRLQKHTVEPVTLTFARPGSEATIPVEVGPRFLRRYGLEMELGPVVAIRPGSPAAAAGVQTGDTIDSIDGQSVGDPLTLPQRISGGSKENLALNIQRSDTKLTLNMKREPVPWRSDILKTMEIPSLGIAYETLDTVAGCCQEQSCGVGWFLTRRSDCGNRPETGKRAAGSERTTSVSQRKAQYTKNRRPGWSQLGALASIRCSEYPKRYRTRSDRASRGKSSKTCRTPPQKYLTLRFPDAVLYSFRKPTRCGRAI